MDKSIAGLLKASAAALAKKSETPQLDAEVLLCHMLGKPRSYLRGWPDEQLDNAQIKQYRDVVKRRWNGEPVAYITGEREFWSLPLKVSHDTLIPRSETELLVDRALHLIPEDAEWDLLDLATGCGAVALAMAKERHDCRVVGTDVSQAALVIARRNASFLEIPNVSFQQGDWFEPVYYKRFEVIVSNPPYVRDDDPCLTQGDLRHEPSDALKAGTDGLNAIRRIAQGASGHIVPGGWLLLEHAPEQKNTVHRLLIAGGFPEVETYADLAGHDRVTVGRAE